MLANRLVLHVFLFSLMVIAGGCERTPTLPALPKQDAKWTEYISMHSPARISKNDKIRVMFVNDVIADEKLGKDAF